MKKSVIVSVESEKLSALDMYLGQKDFSIRQTNPTLTKVTAIRIDSSR